jgi:hypothetical protein
MGDAPYISPVEKQSIASENVSFIKKSARKLFFERFFMLGE